ncbi:hypothetical protein TWF788_003246 [Orbilia oligospora]|uniref:Uncharacterized protein n=1 Tax=Orbilia oligospora TaxID=2813651 RepID=A0A7C8U230_ORBOL|nr:hypothetical protein TWF788_003246 [Orbilia oligospora]
MYENFVSILDNYLARNQNRKVLPVDCLSPVQDDCTRPQDTGCVFYPERKLLRIGDAAIESGAGPVSAVFRDWSGWDIHWEMKLVDANKSGEFRRWKWRWEPVNAIAKPTEEKCFSLLVEKDPPEDEYTVLQISISTFLSFQMLDPQSIFTVSTFGSMADILEAAKSEVHTWFQDQDNHCDFKPVFSCINNLEAIILGPPSSYYYDREIWWHPYFEDHTVLATPRADQTHPLQPVYQVLSTLPRLTAIYIATPVIYRGGLDDTDTINALISAVPTLRSLTISEVPPRTSYRLEDIKFTDAPYLQTFNFTCTDISDILKKSLALDRIYFETNKLAMLSLKETSENFRKFSKSRDFVHLSVRVLIGDAIQVPGTASYPSIWNTVTTEHSWSTLSDRSVSYVAQDRSFVWDPLDGFPAPYFGDHSLEL